MLKLFESFPLENSDRTAWVMIVTGFSKKGKKTFFNALDIF